MMDYDTLINQSRQNAAIEAEEMNLVALLRPRVFIDGNKWCVLYGDDLMNGVAGFGDSPIRAVCDFNRAWRTPIAQQPAACGTCGDAIRPDAMTGSICRCAEQPAAVEGFDKWFDEYTKNNYTDEMLAEAAWKAALALAGQKQENGNES